jgi:SSS family solute:Na+ symporter
MGTMAATVLGGASTVGTVRLGYVHGISGFWLCAALGCGIVALNLFLAKPLLKLKIFTVTQVLEKRYNPMARQASAAIMLAYALMIGVTSILAIGTVLQVLFGLPFWMSVLLGGGVVVVYSTIGGMWSLTLTDIVQFVIKTVGLMFILLPICLYRVGGWDELVEAAGGKLQLHHHRLGHHHHLLHDLLLRHPDRSGHLATGVHRQDRESRSGRRYGCRHLLHPLRPGLRLIGMAAHVLIPDLDNVNNAFAAIVKLSLPDGIRGLVIAAALAAMMSTASAGLLAAATTLTEDLLPKLRGGKQSSLGINRLFTLLTGIVVLGIAWW